ncbi:MAG TPA: DUF4097 family beta strand repeat-containing protein [Steroidobacteraceae bacterium]|jgi:DUF4097 and DUF4098 domain-containing protein YvlB
MRTFPTLSACLIALWANATAMADPKVIRIFEKTIDKDLPADAKGVVEITNTSGSVQVSGWDRPEVKVHAELQEGVERLEMDSANGRVNIKVVLPTNSSHSNEARLHVQVPRGSELHVTTVSADQAIGAVAGMQRLSSVSGDVATEIEAADLELKTVSGDVRVKGHGQPARLHVSTVSGDVHMEHVGGDLDAGSVSGDLGLVLDSAGAVRLRTTSGEVHFEGKLKQGANLDAATVSGDLNIRAPSEGGYAYEASTFSGEITDCFDVHAVKGTVGQSIAGTRGAGGGHVRLKAMSGDVELCDRN